MIFANCDRRLSRTQVPLRGVRLKLTTTLRGYPQRVAGRLSRTSPTESQPGDNNYPRPVALCVGAVPKGGPPRTVGHSQNWSMWYDFRECELRPARPTRAPTTCGRPTNLSGLSATSPMRRCLTTNDIAEGDKPRATSHEPLTTSP